LIQRINAEKSAPNALYTLVLWDKNISN